MAVAAWNLNRDRRSKVPLLLPLYICLVEVLRSKTSRLKKRHGSLFFSKSPNLKEEFLWEKYHVQTVTEAAIKMNHVLYAVVNINQADIPFVTNAEALGEFKKDAAGAAALVRLMTAEANHHQAVTIHHHQAVIQAVPAVIQAAADQADRRKWIRGLCFIGKAYNYYGQGITIRQFSNSPSQSTPAE